MRPVHLIETADAFRDLLERLRSARYIALDTESNGFHAYYVRICLVQISTSDADYVVDPLALNDAELQRLDHVLGDPRSEKILHAAPNDVLGLRKDYGFTIRNLFDTAVACRLLGFRKLGLAAVIKHYFGIRLSKKLQRCNWAKRPLTDEHLDYARLDTHYLIPLRHRLAADLRARQLWEQAKEESEQVRHQEAKIRTGGPPPHLRIHGARHLSRQGRRILRGMYELRDRHARNMDRAPFRVFTDSVLLQVAEKRPSTVEELSEIKGFPRPFRRGRMALAVLEAVRQATDGDGKKAVPAASAQNHDGNRDSSNL